MKFYTDYLVSKNLIKTSDIFHAVERQQREQPSIISVIKEMKLISEAELIETLAEHSGSKNELLELLIEKSIISTEQKKDVLKSLFEQSKSLSEILVEEGKVQITDLIKAFDDYLADYGDTQFSENNTNDDKQGDEQNYELGDDLTVSNEGSRSEVQELIENKFIVEIKTVLNQIEENEEMSEEELNKLHKCFHTIRGVISIYELKNFEKFIIEVDEKLKDKFEAYKKNNEVKLYDEIVDMSKHSLSIITKALDSSQDESSIDSYFIDYLDREEFSFLISAA